MPGEWRRYAPLIIMLAAAQVVSLGLGRWASRPVAERPPRLEMPLRLGEWAGQDSGPLDDVTLSMARPTAYLLRNYSDARGRSVELVVMVGNSKTFHSPGMCLPAVGWSTLRRATEPVPQEGAARKRIEAGRIVAQDPGGQRMLVLFLYSAPALDTPSWLRFQLSLLGARLMRRSQTGALLRVTTVLGERQDEPLAWADLAHFLGEAYPYVREAVESTKPPPAKPRA
jgi:EpsI family protein